MCILFRGRFWLKYGLKLDLEDLKESISVIGETFVGAVHLVEQQVAEDVRAVIEDADVDKTIRTMNLTEFHGTIELQKALRAGLWKHRDISKGIGNIKGVKQKEQVEE